MTDAPERKRALRLEVQAKLKALSPSRRALEEEMVNAAIQADPSWQAAATVLVYRAIAPEFSAVGLTNGAWRAGKRVLFPRIIGNSQLSLHEVHSWTQLVAGPHQLLEPSSDVPAVTPSEVEIAIVPGVAWDHNRHRLGRGGGYYDRLLPAISGPKWGIGFDCQMVQEIPHESHDRAVDRVWTCQTQGLLNPEN